MRTLRDAMLTLQGALRAGVISEDEYKAAVRERSGRMLGSSGRLLPKRGWIGTEVNGERALPASQSAQRGHARSVKLWNGKPAPEVQLRDMQIAYDRERVAMGCRSALVRVVKGVSKQGEPVTALAVALSAAVVD
jgi:hypothetical protein